MEVKPVGIKGDGNVEKKELTKTQAKTLLRNVLEIEVEIKGTGRVHSHDENGVLIDKDVV